MSESNDDPGGIVLSSGRTITPEQDRMAYAYVAHYGDPLWKRYQRAFPDRCRGGQITRHAAGQRAAKLLNDPGVQEAIAQYQEQARQHEGLSVESHMSRLWELGKKAEAAKDFRGALKAEELRGKVAGLYIERHQVEQKGDVGDSVNQLVVLMTQFPELQNLLQIGEQQKRELVEQANPEIEANHDEN